MPILEDFAVKYVAHGYQLKIYTESVRFRQYRGVKGAHDSFDSFCALSGVPVKHNTYTQFLSYHAPTSSLF